MPNITLVKAQLLHLLNKTYTDEEFDELCFEFGVEVDEITSQLGDDGKEQVVYVISIPANRYDLLCLEGFARAIRIFLGLQASPLFQKVSPAHREVLTVEASTAAIRPYCVAAILRNVTFTPQSYKSFIDLQDKLHQNICRRRTYVAIGTHDYDTVKGPFSYRALPPQEINFVPLTEDEGRSFSGRELLDFYREDPSAKHLKPYTEIIYASPVYPVVSDSQGTVLSLPPIINSKHSRIQLHTRNVFIECTATDLTKANIVLDTIVTMFSEYCELPFSVEEVEVRYAPGPATTPSGDTLLIPEGRTQVTPLLSTRRCETTVEEVNSIIGVELEAEEICRLCDRMQLGPAHHTPHPTPGSLSSSVSSFLSAMTHSAPAPAPASKSGVITVTVPPTRSDILHAVDVVEDIAIAFGYNKIPQALPTTLTVGGPLPINLFTDLLRAEISRAGYMEMLTHGLVSLNENFTFLNHPVRDAAYLANPVNVEYEIIRTTLLPGALKTLAHNKSISHKEGIKLFEISDVVTLTPPSDGDEVGAKNRRKLIGLYAAPSSSLGIIHGLVDRVFRACQIIPKESYGLTSLSAEEYGGLKRISRSDLCYDLLPNTDPLYFPGMGADVVLRKLGEKNGEEEEALVIGTMGVIHPEVLAKFEISYPCCVVELDLEALL
jgi:phenylalanyl-tRNA synthetase beta chain